MRSLEDVKAGSPSLDARSLVETALAWGFAERLPPEIAAALHDLALPSEAENQIAAAMDAFHVAEAKRQAEHGLALEWMIASQRAYDEVGESPEMRLRWLYEFAHETPTPRSQRNLALEVEAFCQFYGYSGDELRRKAYDRTELPFYSIAGDRPSAEVRVDEALVEELKPKLRTLWTRLKKPGESFALESPVISGLFSQEADGVVRVFVYGGPTREELFWANVVKLFIDVGPFRFCERADCSRAFVPSRPRKRFCSEQCAGRERIARYRASHGESAEERHDRYKKQVRKRLPNAKPGRRPRRKTNGGTK